MQFAIQQWPQLNGSLIGVANETELQNILLNLTQKDGSGVCQSGYAGGKVCVYVLCTFHPHPSVAWMDPSVSLCIHANGYCNTRSLQLPCTHAYNSQA